MVVGGAMAIGLVESLEGSIVLGFEEAPKPKEGEEDTDGSGYNEAVNRYIL